MKTVKKATAALIIFGAIFAGAAVITAIVLSVWANKPRGVRIHLDEE